MTGIPVERLRVLWSDNGAQPGLGATTADVRACEERIGRSLPEEVAGFYLSLNGTEETTFAAFWELYLSDPDAALFAKGALVQPSA